jgi:hypothetical protein
MRTSLAVLALGLAVAAGSRSGARPLRLETDPEEAACVARGGRWMGRVSGRGRMTGCNLPTHDAGKACSDKADCEGPCVHRKCHGWHDYRGCGVYIKGKAQCID